MVCVVNGWMERCTRGFVRMLDGPPCHGRPHHPSTHTHAPTPYAPTHIHTQDFARKHKKEINASPVFRSEFTKMCAKIGAWNGSLGW